MSYLLSMACKFITLLLLLMFLPFKFHCSSSQTWIKAGYWVSSSELPVSDIDSAPFTHLLCGFAYINSSSYQLSINSTSEQSFYTFTDTVKHKNPSITTLLSIWCGQTYSPIFSSMINQSSYRKSFIESSLRTARLYGFQGLDLCGVLPTMSTNMTNLGTLFEEWRAAVESESRNSNKSQLLLAMTSHYLPANDSISYPVELMQRNLDWVHITAYDYYVPTKDNVTGAHAALYGTSRWANTDHGITEWLSKGLSASKMVLGLPYHGYIWTLENPNDNDIGAPAIGPAITIDGSMGYKFIKSYIQSYGYGAASVYNSTFVVNFFKAGRNWFNFDDVEAIKAKVSYAREKRLLGYAVFQLANDDNWVLSRTAQEVDEDQQNKWRLLEIILVTITIVILLLVPMMYYLQRRVLKSIGIIVTIKKLLSKLKIKISAAQNLNSNAPNLQVFSFTTIKEATDDFSSENKLGEGGYGPVYKGKLLNGQEIAVKRLSKTSAQGLEEFENEVSLTAKLQHVNLVRVLGFCTESEEKMLIYEYMPNKSLDLYLFDPIRRHLLDWSKRVHIIEGITQGLLYLQEYSNFTIIHRDIKASNILLNSEMNSKISDFGMARLFRKDELEANTGRIVGTYGYVPPEYVRKGIYSMKYDVYSFGVLLLQIISGKRTSCYYGPNENLNLLEHAYDLWRNGDALEFFDTSLDDSSSSCKLMRCMEVALLCVQENPVDRPSILKISSMLNNETAAIATPKKPAFSINRDDDEECKFLLRENVCSVDDATISLVVPR